MSSIALWSAEHQAVVDAEHCTGPRSLIDVWGELVLALIASIDSYLNRHVHLVRVQGVFLHEDARSWNMASKQRVGFDRGGVGALEREAREDAAEGLVDVVGGFLLCGEDENGPLAVWLADHASLKPAVYSEMAL